LCEEKFGGKKFTLQNIRLQWSTEIQPKSFFGNHLTSWPGFDPRDGKFLFFTFLFILTQLDSKIIPVQKFRQNIE
jgi:hypothetical protein